MRITGFALAAIASVVVATSAADAQSARYFARVRLSGTASTGTASTPPGPPSSPYDGVWGTYSTGRICDVGGYYEVTAACYTKDGLDYDIERCDPAKRPFTQPPCD